MEASLNPTRCSMIRIVPVLWIFSLFFLSLSSAAQPGNTCADPLVIDNLPYQTTDNTSGYQDNYTGNPGTSGCGAPFTFLSGNDVVYSYTAASDAYLNITMTPGQNFSGVYVYGSCSEIGLTCLAAASGFFVTEHFIENFQIQAAQTIYLVIGSTSTNMSYTLEITDQTGKSCETAIPVSALPYSTDDNSLNYGSYYSGSVGSAATCGTHENYLTGDNIVYAYTAPQTIAIDISLLNSNNWVSLFVYDDCANIGTTCMAIGDYGFFDTERTIDNLIVEQGETVYIMVTRGFTGSFAYTLNITEQPGVVCESAIPVPSLPYTTTDNTTNYGIYYPGPPGDAASCGTAATFLVGENVVYSYTATEGNTTVDITLTDDNPFSSLFVYSACEDIGVTCYTQGSFETLLPQNILENVLVYQNQTIYIIVSSVNGMDYTLDITGTQGETCEAPLVIPALPYTDSDNTANFGNAYSGSPGSNCGTTEPYLDGNNAVYKYIPATDNLINISLDSPEPGAAVFLYIACLNIGLYCEAGDFGTDAGERLIENYFLPAGYAAIIVVANLNGNMDYTLTVTNEPVCPPGTESEGLFVGMPCINPGFINTFVNEDCACTGDVAPDPPANNTLENATVLYLNAVDDCPANALSGTTVNAWPTYPSDYCDDEYPDVFYRFNSGNNTSVNVNFINGTIISKTISVGELGDAPGSCTYSFSSTVQTVTVIPNTDYFVRLGSFFGADPPGTFLICVTAANPDVFECPALFLDIGDPCDDGFAYTVNDIVHPNCNCLGELPPTAPPNNFAGTAQILNLNPIGGCPAGAIPGDISQATAEFAGTNCEPDSPDVYYRFNSGNNTTVYVTALRGTIENMVVSVTQLNTPVICSYNFLDYFWTQTVIPNTEYFIRVATFSPGSEGSFTICVSAENPGASITGNINWNSACGSTPATVQLYEPGTSVLVDTYETTVDANGNFTVVNTETGTYDVFVKVQGYLQKGMAEFEIINGPNNMAIGDIINGDIDNNYAINIDDLTAIFVSFGLGSEDPGFITATDLNCDDSVNINDLTILLTSFGVSGDAAPLD